MTRETRETRETLCPVSCVLCPVLPRNRHLQRLAMPQTEVIDGYSKY